MCVVLIINTCIVSQLASLINEQGLPVNNHYDHSGGLPIHNI